MFFLPQRLSSFRFLNSLGNARSNNSAHYDLSDDMFKGVEPIVFSPDFCADHCFICPAFLSEDMTYSCALYSDLGGDLQQKPPLTDTLADAQQRKLANIVARARISRGHRVLEIGSGWGSMAFHIVRNVPDAQVDTITLSDNQCAHVRAEAERLGFSDRIRVYLLDYREMPREWEGLFDRVVSIEMAEHIGLENIEAYWAAIDRVLKKDTGGGAVQVITIPEASQCIPSSRIREAVAETSSDSLLHRIPRVF
jgi:cyclopropane-fatty-acyl-phospholipid synthase